VVCVRIGSLMCRRFHRSIRTTFDGHLDTVKSSISEWRRPVICRRLQPVGTALFVCLSVREENRVMCDVWSHVTVLEGPTIATSRPSSDTLVHRGKAAAIVSRHIEKCRHGADLPSVGLEPVGG